MFGAFTVAQVIAIVFVAGGVTWMAMRSKNTVAPRGTA
jgi:hypothetical protein